MSRECLGWVVGLPRSLWACFVAATLFFELGQSCPAECEAALDYLKPLAEMGPSSKRGRCYQGKTMSKQELFRKPSSLNST